MFLFECPCIFVLTCYWVYCFYNSFSMFCYQTKIIVFFCPKLLKELNATGCICIWLLGKIGGIFSQLGFLPLDHSLGKRASQKIKIFYIPSSSWVKVGVKQCIWYTPVLSFLSMSVMSEFMVLTRADFTCMSDCPINLYCLLPEIDCFLEVGMLSKCDDELLDLFRQHLRDQVELQ